MDALRLRVRVVERPPGADEEALEHLVAQVRAALDAGRTGAAAVVVRERRTEWVDLSGVAARGMGFARFLAGLTRSEIDGHGPALAVGLAGRFVLRRRPRGPSGPIPDQHVALAFLEWADCRWSLWRTTVGADGALVEDSELAQAATDGDPLPDGLGRWWTLGRRMRMEVQMAPVAEPPALVH